MEESVKVENKSTVVKPCLSNQLFYKYLAL